MNDYIKIDLNSINEFAEIIGNSTTTMEDTLNNIIYLTREMENIYDTPTGRVVKESILEFLDKIKVENQSLAQLGNTIKKINDVYKDNINLISQSIGGDTSD